MLSIAAQNWVFSFAAHQALHWCALLGSASALDFAGGELRAATRSRDAGLLDADPLEDPLVEWLKSLRFDLGNLTVSRTGCTLIASNLVISELSIGKISSEIYDRWGLAGPSIGVHLEGLDAKVSGNWKFMCLSSRIAQTTGNFTGVANPGGSARARFKLPFQQCQATQATSLCNPDLPSEVQVPPHLCGLDLGFKFKMNFGLKYLSVLEPLLADKLNSEVKQMGVKGCGLLNEFAKANLTRFMRMLNDATDSTPPTPPPPPPPPPDSIDWTQEELLEQFESFEKRLGPDSFGQALRWALDDTGHVEILPPSAPVNFNFSLNGANLTLSLFAGNVTIDGLDNLITEPIKAESATELSSSISFDRYWGMRPAVNFLANFSVRLSAAVPGVSKCSDVWLESVLAKVGVTHPSFKAKLFVPVKKTRDSHTLAQWYFAPQNCTRDALAATPKLSMLNVSFASVYKPLTFELKGRGLESEIIDFLNKTVVIFNDIYEPYIASMFTYFASSDGIRTLIDNALTELSPPPSGTTLCMNVQEADAKASKKPTNIDWRPILKTGPNHFLDHIIDHLLKKNSTSITPFGSANFMTAALKPGPGEPWTCLLNMSAPWINFTGYDKETTFRLFVPDENDGQELLSNISIACPSSEALYQPEISAPITLAAPKRGWSAAGNVSAFAPCGNFRASMRADAEWYKLLSLPAPPPTACLLYPFSEIIVNNISLDLGVAGPYRLGNGRLLVRHRKTGIVENPIEKLCIMYPRLCDQLSAARLLQPDKVNMFFVQLLAFSHSACEDALLQLQAAKPDPDPPEMKPGLVWASICILAVIFPAVAAPIFRCMRKQMSRNTAMNVESCMMAECWREKGPRARIRFGATSLLLAASVSTRILGTFYLPVLSSVASLSVDDLGELAHKQLITFTFWGLVAHYWEAGAWFSVLITIVNSFAVPLAVTSLALAMWLVPMKTWYRRPGIRLAIFFGRMCYVEVTFYSLFLVTMLGSFKLPLSVSAYTIIVIDTGIYVCLLSTLSMVLALHCLQWPLLSTAAECIEVPTVLSTWMPRWQHKWPKVWWWLHVKASLLLGLGMLIWCFLSLYSCSWDGVAGLFMDEKSYSSATLLSELFVAPDLFKWLCKFGKMPIFATLLTVVAFLAPMAQLIGAAQVIRRKPWAPAMVFVEFGNTFSALDVLFASVLAMVTEGNDILHWIVNNPSSPYSQTCDALEKVIGKQCATAEIKISWLGIICLFVMMSGSFPLMVCSALSHAFPPQLEASEALAAEALTVQSLEASLPFEGAETAESHREISKQGGVSKPELA